MEAAATVVEHAEVAPIPDTNVVTLPKSGAELTPMAMLNHAVATGAGLEVVSKLMDLQERWERSQARRAFDAAISEAKRQIPVIEANRAGHNNKRYADFAAFARAVDPILGQHGLSYRFRTTQEDRISVTCILSHRDGHAEETTLSGPADKTGSKNDIQAIGSTLTYLQRYSLKQALGLAASDDDDGKAAGAGGTITTEQAADLNRRLDEIGGDKAKFCRVMGVESIPDIPAAQYGKADQMIRTYGPRKATPEKATG